MKPDSQIVLGKYFRQCVGIDVSKEKFVACLEMYDIVSDVGCNTACIEFKNTKTGFNQLVKWSRKECLKDYPLTFLMEFTGIYHEPLAYHLHKLGMTIFVVVPNKARDFARYEGIRTKTDEMDARSLALLGCYCRKLRPWFPPKPIFKELRQMTRFAVDITKIRTQIVNHIEALNHGQTPQKSVVGFYERFIADIDRRLKENEKNIIAKVDTDKELSETVSRLETIKGVRFLTIVSILAETDGFSMITNRKQLTSYAGLDVVAKQSGPQDPKHRISKAGNARIRAALYWPAITACHYNKQIQLSYGRICERNPNVKMIGVTAAMRRLLLLIYTLWKNGETYDPEKMK